MKTKIHFCGGEGINWALDHDLARTIRASEAHAVPVELEEAELIHSVWWRAAARLPEKVKQSQRLIGCFADEPGIVFGDPDVLNIAPYMTAWICEYRDSLEKVRSWGLPAFLVPSVVDTAVFFPDPQRDSLKARFLEKHGIPQGSYLIGNFHRDSSAENLNLPKRQKGADGFLEIVDLLWKRDLPVHAVLAGPRRHWLRAQMTARGIPFTYVGQVTEQDDRDLNTMTHDEIKHLFLVLDLYLVTSRWEGAPNAVLEAAATKTPILSTRVGQAPDILTRRQIYDDLPEALELIEADINNRTLQLDVEIAYEHILKNNVFEKVAPLLRHLHAMVMRLPVNPGEATAGKGLFPRRGRRVIKRYPTGVCWSQDSRSRSTESFLLPEVSPVPDRDRSVRKITEQPAGTRLVVMLPRESDLTPLSQWIELMERHGLSLVAYQAEGLESGGLESIALDECRESDPPVLGVWIPEAHWESVTAVRDLVKAGLPVLGVQGTHAREIAHLAHVEWKEAAVAECLQGLQACRGALGRLAWPQDNEEIRQLEQTMEKQVNWK